MEPQVLVKKKNNTSQTTIQTHALPIKLDKGVKTCGAMMEKADRVDE